MSNNFSLKMADHDEQTVLVLALMGLSAIAKRRFRRRQTWQRKWLQRRETLGCFENLMRELALEDSEAYRRWLRMDVSAFEELVALVSPYIEKKNTVMRKAIPAAERIALTLRFLATGETQSSLSYQFRIAQNTISGIIPSVCAAICHCLQIQVPNTEEDWKDISEDFWKKWNYPLCLGALDGKHVKIAPPPNSGATFRNYKGFFSVVLLALVDANLQFTYVDVGTNGRISDGGVWDKSKLKKAFQEGTLNIPKAGNLPRSEVKVPYVIVADDAFPLQSYIMKPYQGRTLSTHQLIHNYRLSRARRVSENAFGILAARFRIFGVPIASSPANCKIIVMAACSLHNYLIKKSIKSYLPKGSLDEEDLDEGTIEEGSWRDYSSKLQPCKKIISRGTQEAKDVRKKFCDFFNAEGAVEWQNRYYTLH